MPRWKRAAACALICVGVTAAQDGFRLVSELRTTYADAGTNAVITWHTYESTGERISKTAYDGGDTLAAILSSTRFAYDGDGNVSEELLLNAAGDTLSIVAYLYNAGGALVSARVNRADGSLRYRDSLLYTGGELTELRRYNAAGDLTFYHVYGYITGLRAYDSLYEDAGGTFAATQAVLFARDGDGRVTSESSYRLVENQWFLTSTVVLDYADTLLASATEYEGDGSSQRMIDSLAFGYDTWGNRTREERYDEDAAMVYSIDYTWRDVRTHVARARTGRPAAAISAAYDGGVLRVGGIAGPSDIALFDIKGTQVLRCSAGPAQGVLHVAADLPCGRYVVRATGAARSGAAVLWIAN